MNTTSSSPHPILLMSRLGVAFLTWRRYLQRQLLPYGITLKQQFVLRQLARQGCLYPADIAEMLFCDRPTATVILDNLEKQGWVRREKDPANRKYVQVFLTSQGKSKLEELEEKPKADFDPLACLSPEEVDQLEALLVKLCRHLKQVESASDMEE
jgi:DNA-binding MarR family transcriptional regulator